MEPEPIESEFEGNPKTGWKGLEVLETNPQRSMTTGNVSEIILLVDSKDLSYYEYEKLISDLQCMRDALPDEEQEEDPANVVERENCEALDGWKGGR